MHALVGDHRADRRVASRDYLPGHDDVGDDTPVIDSKVAAGAADPADHLIVYHQDVVLVADLANLAEVLPRRRGHPQWSCDNRLGDERGDRLRPLTRDHMLELVGTSDITGGIGEVIGAAIA